TTPSQSSSRSLQNSMLSLHVHSPARQTIPLSPQERPSQSASAQSTRPSQSSSLPSPQMRSVKPLGQGQVPEAVHVAPPGPHTAPPQSGSAQSTRPSQSSSAPSPQLVSEGSLRHPPPTMSLQNKPAPHRALSQAGSMQSVTPSPSSSTPSLQKISLVGLEPSGHVQLPSGQPVHPPSRSPGRAPSRSVVDPSRRPFGPPPPPSRHRCEASMRTELPSESWTPLRPATQPERKIGRAHV